MHFSKNEHNNSTIFYDTFNAPSKTKLYQDSTYTPMYSTIYTKTQVSQIRNIPIPQTQIKLKPPQVSHQRNISNQAKFSMNSSIVSQEQMNRNITSIEINNPNVNQIIKQNISFKNSETNEANPKANVFPNLNFNSNTYATSNANATANQFSNKAIQVLLFNNTKPEGYLNIVSSKSFNLPDLKPDEYIQQRNKMREEREKMRSLSNLILHNNKSTIMKEDGSLKAIFDSSANSQHRSQTTSPNKKCVKEALNMLFSKQESKNVIITRAMRLDRGGVVDLGSVQRSRKNFNISNWTNTNTNAYSQKVKVKAAMCIQLWWRRILLKYQLTLAKVKLIQRNYKCHYNKAKALENAIKSKKIEDFTSKNKVLYKNMHLAFKAIKGFRLFKMNTKERNAIVQLDFMLVLNIQVIKQRTLDKIKERATVKKIYDYCKLMTQLYSIITKRNIILNGDDLIQRLKDHQRALSLDSLLSYMIRSQLKKRFNQYKTVTFALIPNNKVKSLCHRNTSLLALLLSKTMSNAIRNQNKAVFNELSQYESQSKPKLILKSKPRLIRAVKDKSFKDHLNLLAKWIQWKNKAKTIKVLKSIRLIQSQTKDYLAFNHKKTIKRIFYKRLIRFPFEKIIQEANRRTLIKSLFIIRQKKLNNLAYAFLKIKKYTEIKLLVQDTCARIIQMKFLNAFPDIKARHYEAIRIKNHQCNSKVLCNAVRLIQYKYKLHRLLIKTKAYNQLRDLFIHWTVKLRNKRVMSIDSTALRRYFNGAKILLKFYLTSQQYFSYCQLTLY